MRQVVLCYNLKGTKRGKQIAMIFGFLKFRVRHVEREEYLKPIGMLSGLEQEEDAIPVYTGEGFKDEMLVIQSESEGHLDQALYLMKKEGVSVALKAMVTPSNQTWNSVKLHDEIRKEHVYMTEKEEERKQKD